MSGRIFLLAITTSAVLALPAAAQTAKSVGTAFSGKIKPDIIGLSPDSDEASARAMLEGHLKERGEARSDALKRSTAGSSSILALTIAPGVRENGEAIVASFASPANANRAVFISRTLTFAPGREPAASDMVEQIVGKYGAPTLVGSQNIYYVFRRGKLVTAGQKYDSASAAGALDKPPNSRAALTLSDAKGHGSCIATIKSVPQMDKSVAALEPTAKASNCDGILNVSIATNADARVEKVQFVLVDFKRIIDAALIDGDTGTKPSAGKNAATGKPKL